MTVKPKAVNLPAALITVLAAGGLLWLSLLRAEIDTDITKSLPAGDPALADARRILLNHTLQDQIVIDLGLDPADPEALVKAATLAEKTLADSGLFKSVGTGEARALMPDLMQFVMRHLPALFTRDMLRKEVAPLLAPDRVRKKLREHYINLTTLQGVGQADMTAKDPLELRNLILARLAFLAPSSDARMYKGHILSPHRKHLLIPLRPMGSGTDAAFARQTEALMASIDAALKTAPALQGKDIVLTPAGAYRAALDNERTAKKDMKQVILLAAAGILGLLVFAFPRPYLGLLSLLPAAAGTVLAFFCCTLLYESISMLTIGFGGAIVSITVDHGIAYLLFLDRPEETSGRVAAREIRAVGLLAALTTIGAFLALSFSGFAVLAQIGVFAALGILFSFAFVHTVFPVIFPKMPPARRARPLPLQRFVNALAEKGGNLKAWAALVLAGLLLPFVKPTFNTDLRAMNTVTPETKAAENLLSDVWGNILSKVYVMTEGDTLADLMDRTDAATRLIEGEGEGVAASAFTASMVFPGETRARENFAAWRAFWDARGDDFGRLLEQAAADVGFSGDAFAPFLAATRQAAFVFPGCPERFREFIGVARGADGAWTQLSALTPGDAYRAESFFNRMKTLAGAHVFDPSYFSERLGRFLSHTFRRMLLIVGLSALVLIAVFFLDVQLTIIAMLPILFALVCALGTLNLIGHAMDIPALMLSIVVIGMGIDYALFLVVSHQRYIKPSHPHVGLVRLAVLLASGSTIAGFGAMSTAGHALLKSAGVTSLTGIGFALAGAFAILPPLLKKTFAARPFPQPPEHATLNALSALLRGRYRHAAASARLSVLKTVKTEPALHEIETVMNAPKIVLDIGCGLGVFSTWLLLRRPDARVFAVESDHAKAALAARAFGERGVVKTGPLTAPPDTPAPADAVLMIDVMQRFQEDELKDLLQKLRDQMAPGGRLVIRTNRTEATVAETLAAAAFQVASVQPSGNGQQKWIIGE